MEVVFSLQRLGSDAVFSLQFLSGEEVAPSGGFPARTAAPERQQRRAERAEPAEQPEALARAEEIAEAAVARAAAPPRSLAQLVEPEQPAPVSLLQVMQLWVSQPPVAQTVVEFVDTPGPTLAQLDEDAILAATVLLFTKRG